MVAASGIDFVRHEGEIRSRETDRPLCRPAHPCNMLAGVRDRLHPSRLSSSLAEHHPCRNNVLRRAGWAGRPRLESESGRSWKRLFRYKVLIGPSLRARTLSDQKVEARIAYAVINRMTSLGMPVS
jgi:hypothetical protein